MRGSVIVRLKGKEYMLRFNNYSREAMQNQLRKIIPKESVDARRKAKKISLVDAYNQLLSETVEQSKTMALQALIHAGMCGDAYPQFKLPAMTIQEVGQILAELTDEEALSMWVQVNEAKEEADGPAPKKKAKKSPSPKKKS